VWAVILIVSATTASASKQNTIRLVGLGWAIGWLSATIARAVYPPPKSRHPAEPQS
jgi:hypothetical protein